MRYKIAEFLLKGCMKDKLLTGGRMGKNNGFECQDFLPELAKVYL